MKVCLETFGCRLNRAEALQMEADFIARGWQTTESHSDADMIVVRGCSVTSRAQRDCEKFIEHIRAKYPNKRLVATGCLQEKRNEHWLKDVSSGGAGVPSRTARAYLKVQDGCAGACTFCIVPRFRGKSVSSDFNAALDRAKAFIGAGYREIVLTGCNLALYASQGRRLADLAAAMADLDPACRIRLGSVEPSAAATDLVAAMAGKPNICRYLHVPIQSGSNMMLSAMHRPYAMRNVETLLAEALRLMPDLAIGCDLMTGFPGESELDFLATKTLFQRIPISRAHIFPYSERPGTAAAALPMPVPREIRHARAHELAGIADEARTKFAAKFRGKTVRMVVEDEENLAGWTGEYLWCQAKSFVAARLRPHRRELVEVRVTGANGHVLAGELC